MGGRDVVRVLQVCKYYAPFVGGMERVARDVTEALRGGHDVRVLACNHLGPRSTDRVDGVEVLRAAMPAVLLSMPLSTQYYPLLRRLVREAEAVHFHVPFPLAEIEGLIDGCEGRRVFATYHHDVVRQRWLMPFFGPVLRAFLRRCDRIFVCSERLRDRSPWLSEVREKCVVAPFGLRIDERREEWPIPARDFVLFAGRLVPYKGVDVLIRAMKSAAAPLLIVGEGPLRARLERLARTLGVEAHFVGRLTGPRLRHAFDRCRVFVLPSVMNTEAFGLVQLEAMAAGKPVVNTDLPTGVPEVSPHEVTGLTVPPGDAGALSAAISRLLSDKALYARCSANGTARAKLFSMERFAEIMRRTYQEVIRGQ